MKMKIQIMIQKDVEGKRVLRVKVKIVVNLLEAKLLYLIRKAKEEVRVRKRMISKEKKVVKVEDLKRLLLKMVKVKMRRITKEEPNQ